MRAPALAQAVVDVHCTNCGTGWTDYVGAFAGLLGAVLAGVALWLTVRSAADARDSRDAAERSASASEESAATAKEELTLFKSEVAAARAERARRAAFNVKLTANPIGTQRSRPPGIVMVHVGVRNVGDLLAEHGVLNVVVPPAAGLDKSTDENGNGIGRGTISRTRHDLGRGPEDCKYWSVVMRALSPGKTHYVEGHLMLRNPAPGTHPLDVSIDHDDLPGDTMRERWELTVPEAGGAVGIRRVATLDTPEGEDG